VVFVTGFVLGAIGGLLQRLTWETAHAASAASRYSPCLWKRSGGRRLTWPDHVHVPPARPRYGKRGNMIQTQERTERWHRHWDKKSRSYDREMRFLERVADSLLGLLASQRRRGRGRLGTGLNFGQPAVGAADRRRSQRADAGDRFYTCASSA
jgi:hypothetical protein